SSCSSRTRACSGDSPGSRLPPGNSQRPARSRPSVRRASSTRPRASVMAAAMTSTRSGIGPWSEGSVGAHLGATGFMGKALSRPGALLRGGVVAPDVRLLGQLSMAVLVLLAAAAGAWVVAADLGAVARDRGVGGGSLGDARLLGLLVGAEAAGVGVLELHLARGGFGLGALLRLQRGDLVLAADAHARQQRDDLALD